MPASPFSLPNTMKLADLNGRFLQLKRTPDVTDANRWTRSEKETIDGADGVIFLDPRQFEKNGGPVGTCSVICWFRGRVPDNLTPGPGRWTPSGTGIADLSLTPSIDLGNGEWHGWITDGEVK